MQVARELAEHGYPREAGPGVRDIHSPRVPSTQEVAALRLRGASEHGPGPAGAGHLALTPAGPGARVLTSRPATSAASSRAPAAHQRVSV